MSSKATRLRTIEGSAGVPRRGYAAVKRIATNDVLLVSLALGTLIIIFFFDVVFLGRTLVTSAFQPGVMGVSPPFGYPGDPPIFNSYLLDPLASAAVFEPGAEKAAQFARDFQVPLWDANTALGRPFLASFIPEVTSPIRLPLAVWSSPEMWDAFLLSRLLVAGLFTYLLAKRLGLVKPAAFGAAVAFIFSGYFMLQTNMPHPDYAMMIPVLLYALELLLERPSPGRMAFAAAAVALGILADNPETGVILLLFGAAYYLARTLADSRSTGNFRVRHRALPLGIAMSAGAGLTAFVLLPFLELTGPLGLEELSVHLHTPESRSGLQFQPLRTLVSLFVPFFDGPPLQSFQGGGSGTLNYVGLVVPVLALIGLWNRPAMRKAGWFFLGAAVFLVAKTYGVPVVNWVGHLPVLDVITFPRYLGATISFSLAMLAGVGLDHLSRGSWRRWHLLLALVVLALLLGWLVWLNRFLLGGIPKSHLLFYVAVAVGLPAAAAAAAMATRWGWLTARAALAVMVALITVEFFMLTLPVKGDFGFITQELYGRHLPILERPQRYDPYTEPPYISFLEDDTSKYRVMGLDYLLYPNASMVYGIDDIRGFTPATVERYFEYIRSFINPSVRSRFTGAYLSPFNSEREPPQVAHNPKFDLLNVRYVITPVGLPEAHELTGRFLAANPGGPGLGVDAFNINNVDDLVLFEHPPSSLSLDLTPSEDTRFLAFRLALDPTVWTVDRGDGVLFEVSVVDGDTIETVFSRWVDPKNNPEDRRWIDGSVELSPYLGQPITLVLATSPGETDAWDWAGWGGLRLAPSPETAPDGSSSSQFELVYDGEVEIYLNHHAFPRAFVVHKAEIVPGMNEAIVRMKEEGFDPSQVAVIEADLPPEELAALAEGKATGGSKVEITEYRDDRVKLRVETEKPGLLVLSDTYYPGWKAYVDGEKTPIYPTDVALRSVYLEPGEHEVKFVYSPGSFKVGALVSVLSLLALGVYAGWGVARDLWMRLGWQRRSHQTSQDVNRG